MNEDIAPIKRDRSVFICYAREDENYAWRLFGELRRAGFLVWFDKESLLPGSRWETWINEAIQSCRYFVVLISHHSVAKTGYVQKELRIALNRLDKFPESEIFIIPARLDDVEPKHPKLQELQWADLIGSWTKGVETIVAAMNKLEERPADRFTSMAPLGTSASLWLTTEEAAAIIADRLASTAASGDNAQFNARCVVGITGAAGLGKTTLCGAIVSLLNREHRRATHVKLDGFLHGRKTRQELHVCGYNLGGWRTELADERLDALIRGGRLIDVPTYLPNGTHGSPVQCEPAEVVLLDGNYSAFGNAKSLLTVRIHCHCDLLTARYLRFHRDTKEERRFTDAEEEEVWERELVSLAHYVLPQSNEADILIEVDTNRKRRVIWREGRLTRR